MLDCIKLMAKRRLLEEDYGNFIFTSGETYVVYCNVHEKAIKSVKSEDRYAKIFLAKELPFNGRKYH